MIDQGHEKKRNDSWKRTRKRISNRRQRKSKRKREATDRLWNTRGHENDREGTGSSNWEEERLGNCGEKEKKEKGEDERHVCQACG